MQDEGDIRADAEFLRRLREELGDSPFRSARPELIGARMGLDGWEVDSIVERLLRTEYIEQDYQEEVRLTDAGRQEAAKLLSPQAIDGDDEARRHIYIAVTGNANTIQAGTVGSSQSVMTYLASERSVIMDFLAALSDALDQLPVSDQQREIMRADLDTAEAQLRSPKPRSSILQETLSSLQAVVLGMVASGAYAGLVELAQRIHL